ncbi:MAG: Xaa-Pro peptidase family protein [Acidobacteriota bacterium]|nr:Xaa-Pro peptidase family protein [Acidobacteriota bacterium]
MLAKRLVLRSLLLLLAAGGVRAQEGFPLFTTDYPPEEFAARRSAVYDAIGKGAVAVVPGAPTPVGYVRFRQSNDFYYLCGVEVPNAYLLLDGTGRRAVLFLPHRNANREKGEGKMLSAEDAEEVQKLSGVESVLGVDLLAENLGRFAQRAGAGARLFTPLAPGEGFAVSRDLALRRIAELASDPFDGSASREGRFAAQMRERFPQVEIRDLTPTLDGLRLIKSPREIAMLRRSTRLAGLALIEGMRSTRPGQYERELDGMAKFIYYRNGAQGEAYYSLIASSRNAWYPHYNAGKRKMEDGDFLLMDFAPDVGYAMSDVTRMWPVNGRFAPWQRELYQFYLGCYEAILKAIRPGVTASECMQEAAKKMDAILASSKFSKEIYRKAAQEFVASYRKEAERPDAALGHWVGMATHDDGPREGPLKPGMVFTIEPALRVPEEKIYVRLEDMIVVTDKGIDILSDFVPRDIARIEKLMTEKGLLKTYPRED